MARTRITSKSPNLIRANRDNILKHWDQIAHSLSHCCVDGRLEFSVRMDFSSGAGAQLTCRDRNYAWIEAEPHKGGPRPVVPFGHLDLEKPQFWLSWTELWTEPGKGPDPRFQFKEVQICLFFGRASERRKMQLFRCEWPGALEVKGNSVSFAADTAGHPHWQFDAQKEDFLTNEKRREFDALKELLDEPGAKDFVSAEHEVDEAIESKYTRLNSWLSKIHFPASAGWARVPWDGSDEAKTTHAHTPETLIQVRNWVVSSTRYLRTELGTF